MSSSAICDRVAASMASVVPPMRASPDSLRRMRRYFTPAASGSFGAGLGSSSSPAPEALRRAPFDGRAVGGGVLILFLVGIGLAGLLLHFRDEVVGALLEALADLVADEAAHAHVLARLRDEVRLQRAHVLLALGVLDPDLVEQADLL